MNPWKIVHAGKIIILLVSIFFQNVLAGSIVKDLVLATILTQILKPRFVPLPIPFPLPLKFQKHTYKKIPVPVFSHALSTHNIGPSLFDYDLSASTQNLAGHHDLSSLTPISSGHDTLIEDLGDGSDLIYDNSNQVDSIHDDINAIGGLDVLTDIDELGGNQKWW